MATWAYECRSCPAGSNWWVARDLVDSMPPGTSMLRVKVGAEWRCGVADRTRAVEIESQLLREAVASDPQDCPECAPQEAGRVQEAMPATSTASSAPGATIQAAAISVAGRRILVVLVPLSIVENLGEAEMLVTDLLPRFGGVDIVLMAQEDDGTPHYLGEKEVVALLDGVPVDRMPWKAHGLS